jgi:hypothetical protein
MKKPKFSQKHLLNVLTQKDLTLEMVKQEFENLDALTADDMGLPLDEFIAFRSAIQRVRMHLDSLTPETFNRNEFVSGFIRGRSDATIRRGGIDFSQN